MKKIFKKLRQNEFINRIIRSLYYIPFVNRTILGQLLRLRWRIYGAVKLKIGNSYFTMYSETDDLLVDQLFYGHYDEYDELLLFSNFCKKSMMIIDIGANTGLYSLVASKANKKAKIHAFEPYPENAKRLIRNLDLNRIYNVKVNLSGVGDEKGRRIFFIPDSPRISQVCSVSKSFAGSHSQNDVLGYEGIEVEFTTLDYYKHQQKLVKVDLIKIDVESHELGVFLGIGSEIIRDRPVIFSEIHYSHEKKIFFTNWVKDNKYSLLHIKNNHVRRVDNIMKSYKNYILLPVEKSDADLTICS